MIDINFLNGGELAGLEYLHFQRDRGFYLELTEVIENNLSDVTLSTRAAKEIETVISKYSGFENCVVELVKDCYTAGAHGTAFFSPKHVLRNKGLEDYLSEKETTAFKTLKSLEKDVLSGWVDYRTGKVCGDFTKIKCMITIDTQLDNILPTEPKGLTYAQAYALIFMHEVGHFFNNCATIADVAGDDYISKMAVAAIARESDPIKKSAVLKHAGSLLEFAMNSKEAEEVIAINDPIAIDLYLATKVSERDNKRALSMGITNFNSEVLADAYAVRMGGGVDVAKMVNTFRQWTTTSNKISAVVETLNWLLKGLLINNPAAGSALFALNLMGMIRYVTQFSDNNMTYDYNTPQRRVNDVLKQAIQLIRSGESTSAEKAETIKIIDELRKTPLADFLFDATSVSPVNTVINRVMGNLLSGGKWSKTEYAHYTSNIASHEVNLLEHKFNALLS